MGPPADRRRASTGALIGADAIRRRDRPQRVACSKAVESRDARPWSPVRSHLVSSRVALGFSRGHAVRLAHERRELELGQRPRRRVRAGSRRRAREPIVGATPPGPPASAVEHGLRAAGVEIRGRLRLAAGSTPSASEARPPASVMAGRSEPEQRIRARRESAEPISPGTANTSRPSSSAKSAVMSAPLRSRASTTTVATRSARR